MGATTTTPILCLWQQPPYILVWFVIYSARIASPTLARGLIWRGICRAYPSKSSRRTLVQVATIAPRRNPHPCTPPLLQWTASASRRLPTAPVCKKMEGTDLSRLHTCQHKNWMGRTGPSRYCWVLSARLQYRRGLTDEMAWWGERSTDLHHRHAEPHPRPVANPPHQY